MTQYWYSFCPVPRGCIGKASANRADGQYITLHKRNQQSIFCENRYTRAPTAMYQLEAFPFLILCSCWVALARPWHRDQASPRGEMSLKGAGNAKYCSRRLTWAKQGEVLIVGAEKKYISSWTQTWRRLCFFRTWGTGLTLIKRSRFLQKCFPQGWHWQGCSVGWGLWCSVRCEPMLMLFSPQNL